MKNVSFRATETLIENLQEYGKPGGAAEQIVPGFFAIKKYTLFELKGLFCKEELEALIDSQNGLMLIPEYQANKGVLLAHLKDFETYENGISRHKVIPELLFKKIEKLSASQAYFLQDEIGIFWSSGTRANDFIKRFI